ncbi:MAG: outer membrane protein assembly factor BamD [Bacteroidia bacterium]|nr:outer membrane protein assembly factor BamD [Bacteroidia bacterium]
MRLQLPQKLTYRSVFIAWSILAVITMACDPYAKLAKSRKISDKDSAAAHYHSKKNYQSASFIYEELLSYYRGSAKYETTLYRYADCKYYMGEYISAAHYFEEFTNMFPSSPLYEECTYRVAYCHYQQTLDYELDQTETAKTIDYFQLFLAQFPNSQKAEETNKIIHELRERLSEKAFKQANLYYKIGYYKAAVISFKNVLADYPDSKFREESQFKIFKASVLMAQNSIDEKKETRYLDAVSYYDRFKTRFKESKYTKEAENLHEDIQRELNKFQKKSKP